MADSIIKSDSKPGGDGWLLTRLAKSLGRRIPLMCFERLLHDGRQTVPTMNIPAGIRQRDKEIYLRFIRLGRIDLASPIVKAAVDRQRPTGFRRIGSTGTDARADNMYHDCRLQLQIPRACSMVGWYGSAYWLVAKGRGKQLVQLLSPWQVEMSADEDSACVYDYDEANQLETLTLLRLVRDQDGEPSSIYSRRASRKRDSRSLVREDDEENVTRIGDSYDLRDSYQSPDYWDPGDGWKWDQDPDTTSWDYALKCGHLPLFRQSTEDGESLVQPHIPTLERIDTGIFDRMCIINMQAFRQRAIKGMNRTTYQENDPDVKSGLHQAGEKIDFSSIFAQGPAALWMLPANSEIWESSTTDVQQLVQVEESDIKKLAISSNTPLDILSPDVQGSASGADLKREGLVFKVQRLNDLASDALTGAVQMALVLDGDEGALNTRLEMMWAPIKVSPITDQAQAASQAKGVLPVKTMWRRIFGMTDAEIERTEQDMMDTTFQSALAEEVDALKGASANTALGGVDMSTAAGSSNGLSPDTDGGLTTDGTADSQDNQNTMSDNVRTMSGQNDTEDNQ